MRQLPKWDLHHHACPRLLYRGPAQGRGGHSRWHPVPTADAGTVAPGDGCTRYRASLLLLSAPGVGFVAAGRRTGAAASRRRPPPADDHLGMTGCHPDTDLDRLDTGGHDSAPPSTATGWPSSYRTLGSLCGAFHVQGEVELPGVNIKHVGSYVPDDRLKANMSAATTRVIISIPSTIVGLACPEHQRADIVDAVMHVPDPGSVRLGELCTDASQPSLAAGIGHPITGIGSNPTGCDFVASLRCPPQLRCRASSACRASCAVSSDLGP